MAPELRDFRFGGHERQTSSIPLVLHGFLLHALEKKREVEGGPKKKPPSALGARRRAKEATELCLALCGCLARRHGRATSPRGEDNTQRGYSFCRRGKTVSCRAPASMLRQPVTCGNTQSLLRAAELGWEKESKTASRFRDAKMTHGRPVGKPTGARRPARAAEQREEPPAVSVRVVARCCALASLSWKEPPSGIDPAVGDEGRRRQGSPVRRPQAVSLAARADDLATEESWRIDALTLRGRPLPEVAGSRGLQPPPCRLGRVAVPRVGALAARGSGSGRRRPTRLAADLDAEESCWIDAPRRQWTAAPRGRAMSRRVLRPRKCGTGAGGSCCRGTGAAAGENFKRAKFCV